MNTWDEEFNIDLPDEALIQSRVQTDAEVLLRAAELLENKGWCQKVPATRDGCVCLETAIRDAGNELRLYMNTAIYWIMELTYPQKPYEWNDEDGRTKEEVMDLLINCANSLLSP